MSGDRPVAAPERGDVPVLVGSVHELDEPSAGARAIRGAALRGGGFVAGALLAALSAPLLFRALDLVNFGRYTTVVSLIALVAGVTEGGIGAVGTREYALLEGTARDRLMRNLLGMRITLTAAGCSAAVLFAVVAGYGSELVAGTAVASAALLIGVVQTTYAVPLYASLVIGRQVVAELVRQAVFVALIGLLVIAGAGIVPFLAAQAPPALGLLAVSIVFVRGRMPLAPAFELGYWRSLLRDTFPVALATALHVIYFRSVIIVMSLIAAAVQTGLFATSYRIVEVLSGFPPLVIGTAFPILARAAQSDRDRLGYGFGRLFEVALIGGVWMTGFAVLGAGLAVAAVGGAEAAPAAPVLRLQSITLVQAFTGSALAFALLSLRRHREIMLASSVALVVTVTGAFVLVPVAGARGGALSTVLGELVLGVALVVALRRAEPDLRLPIAVVPKVALAAVVAGGVALLPGLPDGVGLGLFSVLYFAILGVLGALPGEIRAAVVERLPGRSR